MSSCPTPVSWRRLSSRPTGNRSWSTCEGSPRRGRDMAEAVPGLPTEAIAGWSCLPAAPRGSGKVSGPARQHPRQSRSTRMTKNAERPTRNRLSRPGGAPGRDPSAAGCPTRTLTYVNDGYCRLVGRKREGCWERSGLTLVPSSTMASTEGLSPLASFRAETEPVRITRSPG